MTKRGNPEATIQRAIVSLLRAMMPDALIHASGHEQRGHGATFARRQAQLAGMGTLPGFPDLVVIAQGRVAFLEVKSKTGSLSPAQRVFRDAVQAQGFPWALVRSADDALAAVAAAGMETREKTYRIQTGKIHASS